MEDKYGTLHPRFGETWCRPRLWSVAIDSGCLIEDLARAYNVSTGSVKKAVRRWRMHEQAEGKGNQGGDGARSLA